MDSSYQQGADVLDRETEARAAVEDLRDSMMDWVLCASQPVPQFQWTIPHWLSMHPTLLAGRGGIGKSLLAQCLGTALATGRRFIDDIDRPYVVGMFMCEDDQDELWRRQAAINQHFGIDWADLDGLNIAVRVGLNNTLFEPEFGVTRFTSTYTQLREWVNDMGIQYLFLDNVSQVFAGQSANAGEVTRFVNGLCGIWKSYPGAPILMAHPARATGSEFSGSAAWENAVRMRWYLDTKPPDEKFDDGEPDTAVRYLAKRKSNYSERDLVRLDYRQGVLVPEEWQGKPFSAMYQADRAQQVVMDGVRRLIAMGQYPSDKKGSNYLPKLLVDFKLHEGLTKATLGSAMVDLILAGRLKTGVVGQYANRTPRNGLVPC